MNCVSIGFLKEASTAFARAFGAGKVSAPKALGYVRSLGKDVHIRSLGSGSNQYASEVLSPRFGHSVKKIPKVVENFSDPSVAKGIVADRVKEIKALKDLRGSSRSLGLRDSDNIAHLRGSKGLTTYSDMAKGKNQSDRLAKRHDFVDRTYNRLSNKFQGEKPVTDIDRKKLRQASTLGARIYQRRFGDITPTGNMGAVINKFKQSYPNVGDINRSNMVDNKLVDMQPFAPRRRLGQHLDPKAYAKNSYLFNKRYGS